VRKFYPGSDEHPQNAYEHLGVGGGVITGDAEVEIGLRVSVEPSVIQPRHTLIFAHASGVFNINHEASGCGWYCKRKYATRNCLCDGIANPCLPEAHLVFHDPIAFHTADGMVGTDSDRREPTIG
jgi:hypothetical protein